MQNEKLVSIGLPVYNGLPYLRRALDSLLAQDYPNLELIISDNASNDGSEVLCQEYARRDTRIRYYRNESNLGAEKNFKRVLDLAQGELFMWAACDDWWHRSFISTLAKALIENPEHGVAMSSFVRMNEDNSVHDAIHFRKNNDLTDMDHAEIFRRMLKLTADKSSWRIHMFIYGLFKTELVKSIMSRPFPQCMAGDRVLMSEVALATHFCSVSDNLFIKTMRQKPIAERYEQENLGNHWAHRYRFNIYLGTLLYRLLTSSCIPIRRKLSILPKIWFERAWMIRKTLWQELFNHQDTN